MTQWSGWQGLSVGGAWFVTFGLLLLGVVGCFLPIIPGHLLIFLAAVSHRLLLGWVLGRDSGVEWWTFVILGGLLALGQAFDLFSGAVGSKWFGGTKWGAAGAIVGGIVGMFFMPFGLVLGPLLGAYGFESLFANQETRPAMVSGVGSAVGTLANLVVKVILGAVMVLWFLIDLWWIG
jgi:uncharacterized protein YqgC (DUF456 family)